MQVVHSPRSMGDGVLVGRLDGQRLFFQDGVFQVRSRLTPQDPMHPPLFMNRHKRYEVELRGNFHYVVEVDSPHFASCIRLEDRFNGLKTENRFPINGQVSVDFIPQFTDTFVVIVTTVNPGFGEFTLTVREANRLKPMGP